MALVSTLVRRTRSLAQKLLAPERVYVGNGVLLVRLQSGILLYVDGSDVSLTPSLLLTGTWEPWVARSFQRALRPGMRVVDVGANCGFFTLLAAHKVGPTGEVIAIEANSRLTELIQRSLAVNGCLPWTRAVSGAVSDGFGEVELGIPDALLGSASVLIRPQGRSETITSIRAAGAPLSHYLRSDTRVDILKIDVEGAEPLIWRGAEDVLTENRDIKVFMEFAPPMIAETLPPSEFLVSIRSAGFTIDDLRPDGTRRNVDDSDLLTKDWAELYLYRRSV